MKCNCGCKGEPSYLVTGYDYDPRAKNNRGKPFVDEPACINAMMFLEESSYEVGFPFSKKRVVTVVAEG